MVIKEAEPRWAMQRFRNKTYEKAKFEKVSFNFQAAVSLQLRYFLSPAALLKS